MANKKVSPRATPTRDERYMALAFMYAGFSKDPNTQHGAVIITDDNCPLGAGYNGPPRQFDDSDMDWSRPAKYHNIIHSEVNAMNHSVQSLLSGSMMYVTGKPCSECMKDIVGRGITRVIYFPGKYDDPNSMMNNTTIFTDTDDTAKRGKVILEPFKGNLNWVRDWISNLEKNGVFG
jgi:dCMP deaminase